MIKARDAKVRPGELNADGAPVGFWSSLQLDCMEDAFRELGEEVLFSCDAGGYVCNHVFFAAPHLMATKLSGGGCGFVHFPVVPGSDERLARFIEIVRIWVDEQ